MSRFDVDKIEWPGAMNTDRRGPDTSSDHDLVEVVPLEAYEELLEDHRRLESRVEVLTGEGARLALRCCELEEELDAQVSQ